MACVRLRFKGWFRLGVWGEGLTGSTLPGPEAFHMFLWLGFFTLNPLNHSMFP